MASSILTLLERNVTVGSIQSFMLSVGILGRSLRASQILTKQRSLQSFFFTTIIFVKEPRVIASSARGFFGAAQRVPCRFILLAVVPIFQEAFYIASVEKEPVCLVGDWFSIVIDRRREW